MDGNKDQAQKCVNNGKEALDAGDKARAIKLLTKARCLDPTLCIDELLSFAGGDDANGTDDATDTSPTPCDAPLKDLDKGGETSSSSFSSATLRARAKSSPASANGSAAAYTEEQITIVREIKKKRDYYEILGLERSCTVEDVRKAYRKLSLKVHPDKNKARGAEEAFKVVSKSFQCLSNEESRQRYDVSGSDDPAPVRRYHQALGRGFNANGFYDADIDAEEVFRNFFGGMHQATTPFGTIHFRTGGMGGAVVMGCRTLVLTSKVVPFYVKSAKFNQDYPYQSSERVALETRIEQEYVGLLSQNCRHELQRQQWGFQQMTPHCDMLRKYQEGEIV